MYWHPAHERAYTKCLTAFRDHLASSIYRKMIIGLRMNFNPFGTEGIKIYPRQKAAEYAARDRWLRPPGLDRSIPYNGFNKKDALDYVRRIIRKHIELFGSVVPMFIRSSVDTEVLADFSQYLEHGTFGIFETGSGLAAFRRDQRALGGVDPQILQERQDGRLCRKFCGRMGSSHQQGRFAPFTATSLLLASVVRSAQGHLRILPATART